MYLMRCILVLGHYRIHTQVHAAQHGRAIAGEKTEYPRPYIHPKTPGIMIQPIHIH